MVYFWILLKLPILRREITEVLVITVTAAALTVKLCSKGETNECGVTKTGRSEAALLLTQSFLTINTASHNINNFFIYRP